MWEISQKTIIKMAADRGAYIDQSQSLNLHFAEPDKNKLNSAHFYAWKMVCYYWLYCRTRQCWIGFVNSVHLNSVIPGSGRQEILNVAVIHKEFFVLLCCNVLNAVTPYFLGPNRLHSSQWWRYLMWKFHELDLGQWHFNQDCNFFRSAVYTYSITAICPLVYNCLLVDKTIEPLLSCHVGGRLVPSGFNIIEVHIVPVNI